MPKLATDLSSIEAASDEKPPEQKFDDNHEENNRRLQICILCEPSPITYMSGQASRFRLLMQHFSDHCDETHKLQLVTADAVHPSPPVECFNGKIPIHYTFGFCPPQYKSATLSFDATFKTLRVLFPFYQRNKVDLIHVSSPGMFLFLAILASQLYQIPLLMSYHTHIPIYARSYFPPPFNHLLEYLAWWVLLILHWFADLTLVTSPQIADEFRERYGRAFLPPIPIRVWRKGIDTKKFHPKYKDSQMRDRMTAGGKSDDLLVVYIGRLGKEKRLKDLRGVLVEMENRQISTRLCIVGDGPEYDGLRRHFKGSSTIFTGRLDGIDLSKAFASGDIFCMPSDSETLGFVVLESMASGVPCVAANAGGPIDLINDGSTGYLVPPGDVMAFADRLEELQKNVELRRKMSLAGREETEKWSWYASMDDIREQAYPICIENFRLKRISQRMYRWLLGLPNVPKSTKVS